MTITLDFVPRSLPQVVEGEYKFNDKDQLYMSGTTLARFPAEGTVIRHTLNDQVAEVRLGCRGGGGVDGEGGGVIFGML